LTAVDPRLGPPAEAACWRRWGRAVQRDHLCLPPVDDKVLAGHKFSDALPRGLAVATLAARLVHLDNADAVLAEPVRFEC
jgi:ATP-dependent helicase Lhr and Lhr-like helicase